ncbi:MAG: vWA domain-containing protein [bacterium]
MKENLTEIIMIVDRSGSMSSIRSDAEGGFNEFIQKQKEVDGEVKVTVTQFDDKIEILYDNENIENIKEYKLEPRGMTALLDAIGTTINNVGNRLSKTDESERPSKVMVCIITDGAENSSSEFNKHKIKDMIEEQKNKYSWEFVFIGANMDAFEEASAMGIGFAASYDATSKGIRSAFQYSCDLTTSYRTTGDLSTYDSNTKLDS